MKRRSVIASSVAIAGAFAGAAMSQRSPAAANSIQDERGFRWVDEFKKTGDDSGATLQRAIDYVRDIAARTGDTSNLPALFLPSGRYALSHTIETAPWVKLCSVGSVLLDFSSLAPSRNGFACRNETSLPETLLRYPGDRSPFLDGSAGTISILGPGIERAEGWGVVMGNRDTQFAGAVRDAGGRNVVISGWRGALRIDAINTYLCTWYSSRFEQNREEAVYATAPQSLRSINSGERMSFIDCTFAGSNRALHVDTDSMDFVFDSCSFDFNGDVVFLDRGASFGTTSLHHCHIEGIDGLLVNATHAGERLRVVIENSIVLPRHWKKEKYRNAPRLLVSGNMNFAAAALEWRLETASSGSFSPLIGDEVRVEHLSGQSFQRVTALTWRGSILNADSDFQYDSIGRSADTLTHWTVSGAKGKIARVREINDERTRQKLVLDALPGNPDIALKSKTSFPVRPGEQLLAQCLAAGAAEISVEYEFSDDVGNAISTKFFSNGDRIRPVVRSTVPPGASRCRICIGFSGTGSPLVISDAAVWKV